MIGVVTQLPINVYGKAREEKMETELLTCSQALLKFLSQQYVEVDGHIAPFVHGMFAIFGHGNVTGLGNALEFQNYGMTTYRGNNEQGMAHAAIAYAKQLDRQAIIACTSSIGPGALNMVTAAGVATTNRIPLLLFPGDIFADRQPDPVLQQIEQPYDLSISANDAFKPVSKFFDRIVRSEMLISAMHHAMQVLTCPAETGAVVIALPQDVQCEKFAYPISFFEKRIWSFNRLRACQNSIDQAAELLQGAKQPLIISGGGAVYSKASQAVSDFANKHRLPVAVTQAGKSILPATHAFDIGGIGTTGTAVANKLAKQADVILALGTRLQDFTTASKSQFSQAKVIQININRMDSFKMNALSVQADVQQGLQLLTNKLNDFQTTPAYQQKIIDHKKSWHAEVLRNYETKTKTESELFSQTAALGVVNQHLNENDTIICAAGSLPGDLHRLWQSKSVKDYHLEYGFSCMGYEVAAGLGVSLAKSYQEKEGEAFVVVGDGSFIMLHSELVTAIELQQKMTIILFDNSGFQCIQNLQCSNGSNSFKTQLTVPINFQKYAQALGVKTYPANNAYQLAEALKAARIEKNSVLIELKVDPRSMSQGYDSWWRVATEGNENLKEDS